MNYIRIAALGFLMPIAVLSSPMGAAASSSEVIWYRVPETVAVLAIMEQRQCDLKIESVQLALSSGYRPARAVTIRNAGSKAVTRFSMAWINQDGGGEYLRENLESSPLRPGAVYSDNADLNVDSLPVIPTELLADIARDRSLPDVQLYMIVQVTYADGSQFDATDAYRALESKYRGHFSR